MTEQQWQVATLDEIEPRESWIPVREHLGIEAFGINAYRPREDGTIVNEHDEEQSGQQELYVVLDGNATFTIDGKEVETAAGTLVFVAPESTRTATGDATILAIGGKPGEAYQGLRWGAAWAQHRESLRQYGDKQYADAAKTVRDALAANPDHSGLHYNLACFTVLAGDTSDEPLEHLRRAVELYPPFREQARTDEDFASIREDPRFEQALQ
jgi:hypothetical protein